MAKHFVYTNRQTGTIVFQSVEPNYVTIEEVDKKVKDATGSDPRLNPHLLERQIRVVNDNFKIKKEKRSGRPRTNKRKVRI